MIEFERSGAAAICWWTLAALLAALPDDVRGRVVSRLDGDVMLGALVPIHAKGSTESCGVLQVQF